MWHAMGTRSQRFRVGDLCVVLTDAASSVFRLPSTYAGFESLGPSDETLILDVCRDSRLSFEGWERVLHGPNSWQLWRRADSQYLYVPAPGEQSRIMVLVDQHFLCGQILLAYGSCSTQSEGPYTLREIDLRLYMNWLATKGDFVMHAAGVAETGSGYAFVGPAGVGKSTLAAQLASSAAAQVLGEDNVIVRCMDGEFMLYGTPWHTDPRMCSPGGLRLTKLFFLERTMPPGVRRVRESEAVQRLILNSFVPFYDREAVKRILDRMTLLVHQVPCYGLSYEVGSDVLSQIRQA